MDSQATDQSQGQTFGDPSIATPSIRRNVFLGEDQVGAAFRLQSGKFVLGISLAQDQAAATRPQVGVQAAQPFQQKDGSPGTDIG
jgi:hypothetical protein